MTSYYSSIVNIAVCCIVSHIHVYIARSKFAKFIYPTCIQRRRRGTQSEFHKGIHVGYINFAIVDLAMYTWETIQDTAIFAITL